MAEFVTPSFLEKQSVDEIYKRMSDRLPEDFDKSEGSHPWNLLRPHAYETAQMAEYILPEAIKLIFPMFCENYADAMDYHAETRGLVRKAAVCATGELEITGKPGTEIPLATQFSTLSINGEAAVTFETTEDAVIGSSGVVTVNIKALLSGEIGNVAAGTIIIKLNNISGITCTNPEAVTGGTEQESTYELQQRILERDRSADASFGGSEADFKRWALSVNGTGEAIIIHPEDDTTPITIVLIDANGDPANDELCQSVYNYIMSPDEPNERLAPINSQIIVVPSTTVKLTVSATIELVEGNTIEQAKTAFLDAIKQYLAEAADAGEIRYTKIGAIISSLSMVSDYSNLLINGKQGNITVANTEIAKCDTNSVIFTSGTV